MSVFSKEDKIKILSDIVSIKSVNDNEVKVAEYFKDLLNEYNIDAEIDIVEGNRANLIATIGNGKPVLGISGHMDVVSEGNIDDWESDPFQLTHRAGYLYGRGAGDMKSGLSAMIIAMIEIKEQNLLKQGTIKLLATTGEEMEQKGSSQIYKKGYMDDVDALVIGEPSQTQIVTSHKGSIDYRIFSKGKAAHSSMPIVGKNAIKPLIQFIQNLDKDYQEILKQYPGKKIKLSNQFEQIKPFITDDFTPEEAKTILGGLVLTNTIINGGNQVNSIPESATADYNVRTIPEFDNKKVTELFEKHIAQLNEEGYNLSANKYLDLEPVITTGENSLVTLAKKLGQEQFGEEVPVIAMSGVTDASNLLRSKDKHFPLIIYGPGENSHQLDERVKESIYLNFIDLYIELFTTYTHDN